MISCRGRHNRIKAMAFIVMVHENRPLPSWYLAMRAGCAKHKAASMRTLLVRWCKWKLVKMQMAGDGTRLYSITPKGEHWLRRNWQAITPSLIYAWLPGFWQADYYSFLFPPAENDAPVEVDKDMRGHRRGVAGAAVKTSP